MTSSALQYITSCFKYQNGSMCDHLPQAPQSTTTSLWGEDQHISYPPTDKNVQMDFSLLESLTLANNPLLSSLSSFPEPFQREALNQLPPAFPPDYNVGDAYLCNQAQGFDAGFQPCLYGNGKRSHEDVQSFASVYANTSGDNTWGTHQSESAGAASLESIKVGKYSVEERRDRILRYLKKRNQRNFNKTIKYACRKTLADRRTRVRGRFAKNHEEELDRKNANSSSSHDQEDKLPCLYDLSDQMDQDTYGDEWLQEALASLMYMPYIPATGWQSEMVLK